MAIKRTFGSKYYVVNSDNVCTESNNHDWIGLTEEQIEADILISERVKASFGLVLMVLFWGGLLVWVLFGSI